MALLLSLLTVPTTASNKNQFDKQKMRNMTEPEMHTTPAGKGNHHMNHLSSVMGEFDTQIKEDEIKGNNHRRYHRTKRSDPLSERLTFQVTPHTIAQKFTLHINNGHVFLLHKEKWIIDLTDPEKIELTIGDTVWYTNRVISISFGVKEVKYFPGISTITVYNGTHVYTLTPEAYLVAVDGELFVSGGKAFYSNSSQFNELLNYKLRGLYSAVNQKDPIEFRTIIGGSKKLWIDSVPVIILTNAEFRKISDHQNLVYRSNILQIQDVLDSATRELFPGIEQLFLLNRLMEGLKKHTHMRVNEITGGGHLYIHKATNNAFYSQDPRVNRRIVEFLAYLMLPSDYIVFSLQYELRNRKIPSIAILANGKKVLRLYPNEVIGRSISPKHFIAYGNNTLYVMESDKILGLIKTVYEILFYDERNLVSFRASSREIPGGGQLFISRGLGIYSLDAHLNDRIGSALVTAGDSAPPIHPPTKKE